MKYTMQSTKYVAKNLIYILPFAIIPALFLAFSTDEGAIFKVLKAVYHGDLRKWTFGELFCAISVFNFGSWQSIVFGILGLLLIVPCVALMMALLEKHFRIGKRTFNGIWGKLNDNFLSTLWYIIVLLAIFEVWSLLLAAFLFLFSRISVAAVAYVLVVLVYLAMHVLLLYAIGTVYLWLPCMQITGFRAIEALQYSYQLTSPVKWRLLFGQLFSLFLVEALICVCAYFIPYSGVFWLVTAGLYSLLIMTYCVRMMVAYFDRDNIERADLNRYY